MGVAKKIGLVVLVIGLVVGGYFGNMYYQNFKSSNVDTDGKTVYLFIPPKTNLEDLEKIISKTDVIKDIESFKWMAEKKNLKGRNIVPGKYKIEDGWSNNDLINSLRAGNGRLEVKVTFNQVRTLDQLAGVLTKNLMIDSTELVSFLTSPQTINKYGFNRNSFISMFIPNTYYVNWHISKEDLLGRLAKEYKSFWTSSRKAKLARVGLSQSEVTTLASIVYWETKIPKDKKTIAGVYLNRLKIGMPLQADPTLIFAAGDFTIRRVLNKHKEINSPYNTYKNKGLPPGPILIPPISYIDAVLDFDKHKYLYFVAKENFSGESYFSKTYSQHLKYARLYQNALNKRKVFR